MADDPIDRLLAEHVAFRATLGELRRAVVALEGAGGFAAARPGLAAAAALFAGPLEAHARREDDALFPALEETLGAGGPTGPFREEHRTIRAQAGAFRAAVERLRSEHPALAQAGAGLAALVERGEDAPALVRRGREVLDLLEDHFAREESMLFPMARELLDRAALARVAQAMERLD